jgi:hypothetical protein
VQFDVDYPDMSQPVEHGFSGSSRRSRSLILAATRGFPHANWGTYDGRLDTPPG